MADMSLEARSALQGIATPGRHGAPGEPGVTIAELTNLRLFSVAVLKGQGEAFAAAVSSAIGLALPSGPVCVSAKGVTLIGAGPGQWLLVCDEVAASACESLLRDTAGMAAIVEQTDGRAIVAVGGPKARDALAKGISIDLHPQAFPAGSAAVTSAAFIGLTLWRPGEENVFYIAVARSYAGSFWNWLTHSAAEFGYTVG